MSRRFTTYWTPKGWGGIEPGEPLRWSVSNEYGRRGLEAGDRLYVMNVKARRAWLLGSFEVGEVLTKAQAERRFGRVWDGAFVAVAKHGSAGAFDVRPLPKMLLRGLRFVSKDRPTVKFDASGGVDGQTLRSMRELTAESAARLDRILEGVGSDESAKPADAIEALGVPTRAEYRAALRSLERHLGDTQVRMLRAHYLAPDQTATMRELAEAAMLEQPRSANGVYGNLGKLLAGATERPLGREVRARRANWTHMIASGLGQVGRRGEYALRLQRPLAGAMEDVGLVDPAELSIAGDPEPESVEDAESVATEADDRPTERLQLQRARRGQGSFRSSVVSYWGACAVTGCRQTALLIASHIVPWKLCATDRQRLDGANGLLLTPNLDKLFDRGLISFADDGSLLMSSRLREHTRAALGLSGDERIANLTAGHRRNLAVHRQRVFLAQRAEDRA